MNVMRIYEPPDQERIRLGFNQGAIANGIPEDAIDFFKGQDPQPHIDRIEPETDSDCVSGLDIMPPPDQITLAALSRQIRERNPNSVTIKNYLGEQPCAE